MVYFIIFITNQKHKYMQHLLKFSNPQLDDLKIKDPFRFNFNRFENNDPTFVEIGQENPQALETLVSVFESHGYEADIDYIVIKNDGTKLTRKISFASASTNQKTFINFYLNDKTNPKSV